MIIRVLIALAAVTLTPSDVPQRPAPPGACSIVAPTVDEPAVEPGDAQDSADIS